MAAKTEDTARIVVESKESVPVFPPIRIGACGSDNYQTVEIVADDRERPSGMVAELENLPFSWEHWNEDEKAIRDLIERQFGSLFSR